MLPRSFLLSSLFVLMTRQSLPATVVGIGDPAPKLHLSQLSPAWKGGIPVAVAPGRAALLEFWATWCLPCVQEIPRTNELARRFQGQPIDFISVTDETSEATSSFLKKHSISGIVALDKGSRTSDDFGVTLLPTTILIDPHGKIAAITTPNHISDEVLKKLIAGQLIDLPGPVDREDPLRPRTADPGPLTLFRAAVRVSQEKDGGIALTRQKLTVQGETVRSILSRVFEFPTERILLPADLETRRYDASIQCPGMRAQDFKLLAQRFIPLTLGLKIENETRVASVLVLSKGTHQRALLTSSRFKDRMESGGDGYLKFVAAPLDDLASAIQHELHKNVVDETGLRGNYDFTLRWDAKRPDSMVDAIREQLGLSVASGTRSIIFLAAERSSPSVTR